jgi:2-polyprenyl-3-methyl-5-hydroxy-6-metoxy-1,4-benzoquinol methylase
MSNVNDQRVAAHEIEHGKVLADRDPEAAWGWDTPAGRLRAERRAELIINGSRLSAGMYVLEIGCGVGNFTRVFAATGARILGVDISPDLLDRARQQGLPPEQVQFVCKRFEECELDGPFDAVIGSSVLHHLDMQAALPNILRLLKPGGAMTFAEPNMLNPQVFAERKFRFLRKVFWYVSPDETAFVRWSLAGQMKAAGFDRVRITPFDWLHPAVPPSLIPLVRGVGNLIEALPLAREFAGSLCISARRPGPP